MRERGSWLQISRVRMKRSPGRASCACGLAVERAPAAFPPFLQAALEVLGADATLVERLRRVLAHLVAVHAIHDDLAGAGQLGRPRGELLGIAPQSAGNRLRGGLVRRVAPA